MGLIEDEEKLLRLFDEQIEKAKLRLKKEITIDDELIKYLNRISKEIDSAIFFLKSLKRCIEREQTSKSIIESCLAGFKTKIKAVEELLKAEEALKVKKIGMYTEIREILNLLQKLFSALQKRIPEYNV